ncbi:hypothetical protein KSF78_0002880 [Schistosoma japonicum]|nr:hypothetical protein KSF78_0002880 [Schistosoma japonicum]
MYQLGNIRRTRNCSFNSWSSLLGTESCISTLRNGCRMSFRCYLTD